MDRQKLTRRIWNISRTWVTSHFCGIFKSQVVREIKRIVLISYVQLEDHVHGFVPGTQRCHVSSAWNINIFGCNFIFFLLLLFSASSPSTKHLRLRALQWRRMRMNQLWKAWNPLRQQRYRTFSYRSLRHLRKHILCVQTNQICYFYQQLQTPSNWFKTSIVFWSPLLRNFQGSSIR